MTGGKRQHRQGKARERRIVVRGIRRDQPDVQKLARAIIAMARAQAEADAQATTPTANEVAEAASRPTALPTDTGGQSNA